MYVYMDEFELVRVGYLVTRLLLMLVGFSYFVGMIWFVYVKLVYQVQVDMDIPEDDIISFTKEYNLNDQSNERVTLVLIYYSLTTLSSVGFGDYYPQSTAERAGCSVIFLIVIFAWPVLVNALMDAMMKFDEIF